MLRVAGRRLSSLSWRPSQASSAFVSTNPFSVSDSSDSSRSSIVSPPPTFSLTSEFIRQIRGKPLSFSISLIYLLEFSHLLAISFWSKFVLSLSVDPFCASLYRIEFFRVLFFVELFLSKMKVTVSWKILKIWSFPCW